MIWNFARLAASALIQQADDEVIFDRRAKTVVYYYYDQNANYIPMSQEFSFASTFFKDFPFIMINCSRFQPICSQVHAPFTGLVMAYGGPSQQTAEFKGDIAAYDIVKFVESTLILTPYPRPLSLQFMDSSNFTKTVKPIKDSIICFLSPSSQQSKILIPTISELANAFMYEKQVFVGLVDCDKDKDFCISIGATSVPRIRHYSFGDTPIDFYGQRFFRNILNFANSMCGTFRGSDGELNNEAGVRPEFGGFVKRFMVENDKRSVIQQLKALDGANIYISLMKKLCSGSTLDKERAKYERALLAAKDKSALRDTIKICLNIVRIFEMSGPFVPGDEGKEL